MGGLGIGFSENLKFPTTETAIIILWHGWLLRLHAYTVVALATVSVTQLPN